HTHQCLLGNEVQVLTWPSCSPDLNLIENLWGMLARLVYRGGRQFDDVKLLITAIHQEWDALFMNCICRHSSINAPKIAGSAGQEGRSDWVLTPTLRGSSL